MRLFSYKLTSDTGFAPNPFFGILTLACCKPEIRENRNIGDYIAGFTSNTLDGSEIGKEKLIYFMKITGTIPFSKYWTDPRFQNKKPDLKSSELRSQIGDNIYEPIPHSSEFKQLANLRHCESNIERDLKSYQVLFSTDFYYFGASAILLPEEIRPNIPKGQSAPGYETKDEERILKLIQYLQHNYTSGIIDHPTIWDINDTSWRK